MHAVSSNNESHPMIAWIDLISCLLPDSPDPLFPPQGDDHAAYDGGAERLQADADLRLDQHPVGRLGVDLHGVESTPAAGGFEHAVARPPDECLQRNPVAVGQHPALPQGLELLVGPELKGFPEHRFQGLNLSQPGCGRRGSIGGALPEGQPDDEPQPRSASYLQATGDCPSPNNSPVWICSLACRATHVLTLLAWQAMAVRKV
jgi:hypothetical protein